MTSLPRPRRSPRVVAVAAAALLLAPAAVACGSGNDRAEPATKTTTTRSSSVGSGPGGTTSTSGTVAPPLPAAAGEQPYVDALVRVSVAEDNNVFPLDRPQAECIAPRWIRALGVERFATAKIEPEDLKLPEDTKQGASYGPDYLEVIDGIGDAASARAMVDAIDACQVDLVALIIDLLGLADSASEAQVACITDAVPVADIRTSLTHALDGDDKTSSDISEARQTDLEACLPSGPPTSARPAD